MTVEQGMAVADWVSTTGKTLTTVYVTRGHGDHWFGLGAVRERRLMEQRQLSDPFGFLVYAELAGGELSPVR